MKCDEAVDPDYETEDDVDYSDDSLGETDDSEEESDTQEDDSSENDVNSKQESDDFEILQAINFKDETFGFWSNAEGVLFGTIQSSKGDLLTKFENRFENYLEPNSDGNSFHLFIR